MDEVLSVTILETTKTYAGDFETTTKFYRSQFWRLQKPIVGGVLAALGFIGHNFGDYKNRPIHHLSGGEVLSVTILETTKTPE